MTAPATVLPLHESLAILDVPGLSRLDEALRHAARGEAAPTASLVALAHRLEAHALIGCALCGRPASGGRALTLHLRVDAGPEVRLALEELVRAAGLALVDPDAPELVSCVALGDVDALAAALEAVSGEAPAYVLLESEDDMEIFVQVLVEAPGLTPRAECPPVRHHEGRPFARAVLTRLALLGWGRSSSSSSPNRSRPVDAADEGARRALAAWLTRTLEEAYGIVPGAPLVLRVHRGALAEAQ